MRSETPVLDSASLALKAYYAYRRLIEAASRPGIGEQSLGGKLLYAGELDTEGRSVVIAGNVAGCATLAITADAEVQKSAIRDGVVDFVVNSLDEALRILKNEVRKRSTVAVCIASQAEPVEREMLERGVQADFTRQDASADQARSANVASAGTADLMRSQAIVEWTVESLPAKWLPRIDALALESLDADDEWSRRWIQRSPRYLGRAASNLRVVWSDREFAAAFLVRLRRAFEAAEIGVAATVSVASNGRSETHDFKPAA
ncbi:hypothetical protein [Occallatibacter savannae]|uniref:hypothetical protein n=1 Tax=Occallatibacter savannae TaxID=1002691 RepID=UPI0013A58DDC|nr:hypothetical protein [Occallatibacter savannae]